MENSLRLACPRRPGRMGISSLGVGVALDVEIPGSFNLILIRGFEVVALDFDDLAVGEGDGDEESFQRH